MNPDARWLIQALSMPYSAAEYWYRQGILDETDWMLYQFYWRNSAPHFSDLAAQYELKI